MAIALTLRSWIPYALVAVVAAGCSCSDDGGGIGGRDAGEVADGSTRADGAVPADASSFVRDARPAPRDTGAHPEVCNGIDDDLDGNIDNVDEGNDGICDCLLIATIGIPGRWGAGEIFADWLDGKSDVGATHLTPLIEEGDTRTGEDQTITAALLAPFQVIVIQDVSVLDAFSEDELDAIVAWVEAGGGLMTLIGYGEPAERANVNAVLGEVGLGYGETPILPKEGGQTVPITMWTEHPVSEEINRVGVDNGYPVTGDGIVVARQSGHDVARAKTVGDGKVFVWGDEWITYNSEWDTADYQVERFWLNVIKWLTPMEECQVEIPPIF